MRGRMPGRLGRRVFPELLQRQKAADELGVSRAEVHGVHRRVALEQHLVLAPTSPVDPAVGRAERRRVAGERDGDLDARQEHLADLGAEVGLGRGGRVDGGLR